MLARECMSSSSGSWREDEDDMMLTDPCSRLVGALLEPTPESDASVAGRLAISDGNPQHPV